MNDFKFYANTLALSIDNPGGTGSVPCDMALSGDPDLLVNGLVEHMHRHPQLAGIVSCAAFNYMRDLALPQNQQQ